MVHNRRKKHELQSSAAANDVDAPPKPTPKPLLAPEILTMVFEHMKVSHLYKLMTTSRSWSVSAADVLWRKHPVPLRTILEYLHPLQLFTARNDRDSRFWWGAGATLDLFKPEHWDAFVKRTNMVTHVSMKDFTMTEDARLLLESLIAQHPETLLFQNLRSVTLRNTHTHNAPGFHATSRILSVPTLRFIEADRFNPQSYLSIIEGAKNFTINIKRVDPPNFACLKNIETLEVEADGFVKAPGLIQSLKSMAKIENLSKLDLIYSSTTFNPDSSDEDSAKSLRFPLLVDLSVKVGCGLDIFLPHVNAPELRTLKIDTNDDANHELADLIIAKYPNLEELHAVVGNDNFRIDNKPVVRQGPGAAFMKRFFGTPLLRRLRFGSHSNTQWEITDSDFGEMVKASNNTLQSIIFGLVVSPWKLRTNLTFKSLVDVSEYQGNSIEELSIGLNAAALDLTVLQGLKSMPLLGRLKVIVYVPAQTEQDNSQTDVVSTEDKVWRKRWRHWPTFASAIIQSCPALTSFGINITCEKNGKDQYTSQGRDEVPDFWSRYNKYWKSAKLSSST